MTKIKQYNDQAIEMEELKDKNLELYEKSLSLEEQSAGLRHANRISQNPLDTDNEHIKEMLGTQNLLREEMEQKEFFKEQAQNTFKQLVALQDESAAKISTLEAEANRRVLEVQLIEEKNANLLEQIAAMTKKVQETENESMKYKTQLQEKDKEVNEMQMQVLEIKSQIIEKDG